MGIIIIGIFIGIAIVIGLSMYFILKEDNNVRTSKKILYSFKYKCKDDFNKLIEFKKSNNTKYKI